MISLTGEVRKVLDHGYTNKNTGERISQGKLILEPQQGIHNYEIVLTAPQIKSGARSEWEKLVGKTASIEVSLYVNYDYKFHKYTAKDGAKPLLETKS